MMRHTLCQPESAQDKSGILDYLNITAKTQKSKSLLNYCPFPFYNVS